MHVECLLTSLHADVKDIIVGWLDGDGFQEGADGATSVASVVLGEGFVEAILAEKGYSPTS